MSAEIILATEGLAKEFRGIVAVDGVDLAVERGTIHALIGPNGAGKTTCFNLLTKFLSPTRGRITFKGRDITRTAPADVARLGIVRSFQISATFPHLTVLENVRIALQRQRGGNFDFWRSEKLLRRYDAEAFGLVEQVGLASFADGLAADLLPMAASAPSNSPPRWPSTPNSCCSTSPWPAWRTRTSTARPP